MAEETPLTTEQMMSKISEMSKTLEKLTAENKSLKEANDKNTESLQKAREINSELLLRVGVPPQDEKKKEESEKEETFEDIMKETLDKITEKYHLRKE